MDSNDSLIIYIEEKIKNSSFSYGELLLVVRLIECLENKDRGLNSHQIKELINKANLIDAAYRK